MTRAPIWGRRLPEYAISYDAVAVLRTPDLNLDEQISTRMDAITSIQDICRIVDNKSGSELEAAGYEIHLSTLQSVLKLTYTPQNFCHFGNPPLISACIKLMSTIKRSGNPAPFSFEYGYLCYRILSIALGVCLLQRTNRLDAAVADMAYMTPLQVLSEHVSRVVSGMIGLSPDNRYCDHVLGWAQLDNHPNRSPLIPRSDASMLLDLLYEDRKHFLESFMMTYPPVLSGVFFLIWRNWSLDRITLAQSDTASLTDFVSPLIELLCRCCLVVTTDQEPCLAVMHGAIGEDSLLWREKLVDVEDSEMVVRALNNRLVRGDEGYLFDALDLAAIPFLLNFLKPFVNHGAKDSYPELLGSTVNRMWEFLIDKADRQESAPVVDSIRETLKSFGTLLDFIQPISSDIGPQIIDAVVENDLLGLIVRGMTMLKPLFEGISNEEMIRNGAFLERAAGFFQNICSLVPPTVIKSKFHDSAEDWFKYAVYFYWRGINASGDSEADHWGACIDYLQRILKAIQHQDQIDKMTEKPCGYARCPGPLTVGGAQFVCSKCLKKRYCSIRCQTSDWIQTDWQTPHRNVCKFNSIASK